MTLRPPGQPLSNRSAGTVPRMSAFPPPAGPAADGPAARPAGPGPSYGRTLLATLVWPAVLIVGLFVLAGPPGSAEAFGTVIGGHLFASLLAALATWLFGRRRGPRTFWQLVLFSLPAFLIVRFVTTAASLGTQGS